MATIDRTGTQRAADAPSLAMPRVPAAPLPLWQIVRRSRRSSISTWPAGAYGMDLLEWRFLRRHGFVANAPDLAGHVLLDNAENYVRSALSRRLLEPGLGRGLLTAEGEAWRRQRRILAPAFAPRRIADLAPSMTRHAEHLVARWAAPGDGGTIDLAAELSALTLAIISQAMFSVADDPEIAVVGHAVARYQTAIRPTIADLLGLPAWLSWRQDRRARRILEASNRVIARLIAARRRQGGPDDLLAMMLAAAEDGSRLGEAEVRAQVATVFTAGHETTANALGWTFYLLSQHPAERARLEAELDRVLGGRAPGFDDLARLPFTRMVLDEAMRLYPPAHTLSREALAPDRLRDRVVPKGATVLVVPWLLHRHRTLWDAPDRFIPDRFAPAAAAARPRFAYIPFGAGPHVCLGASFALAEAVLILATIAQSWRLDLAPGAAIEPVALITLRPRHGLPMVLRRR